MLRLFTDHPHSVGETYGQHFCFATGFGLRMIVGGIGAVLHGLLPFVFETTGSRTVLALNEVIRESKKRHQKTPEFLASSHSSGSGI
jgi:Family of unknown function (DUF6356)